MKVLHMRLPIALRVGGYFSLIVVGFAVFMVTYFPATQRAQQVEALQAKADLAVRMSSHQLEPALDFDDMQGVSEALDGLELDRDFVLAALFDDKGKRIAVKSGRSEWAAEAGKALRPSTASMHSTTRAHWIEVNVPISTPAGRKASLVAAFSLDSIREHQSASLRATLLAAALVLVFGMAIAVFVGRFLGRRLSRVASVAQRVAAGNLSADQITDGVDDEIGDMVASFNVMNRNLRELTERAADVAKGNLSETLRSEGELSKAFNTMIVNQRELVRQIADTATQLNSAAGEFLANAKQQERGATDQSTAVEEVRRTLESLLGSAREIGGTASDVLGNAERTQGNSQVVAERIAALSTHNKRIVEVLEVIKDIANKSELLALNAGLEGTKAGEAGRGFSLVATQMQRLAENVMGSVRTIKELTTTITEATEASVLATEESTKLASHTTRSARQIGLIIQQQQTGTEQATKAMQDVGDVAGQNAAGSRQIVSSASDLMRLSEQMQALVGKFQLSNRRRTATDDGRE